jgi:hypothetical protein
MIRLYTLLALLLCSYTSQAQKIRFTDTTNEWTYVAKNRFYNTPAWVETYKYHGDSTVDNVKYQVLSVLRDAYYRPLMLVREDTILEKVYYRMKGDTAERILYDYNITIGDTLRYWGNCPVVLVRLDTVHSAGYSYKLQDYQGSEVLEGIGSLYETFEVFCIHPDMWLALSCFKNKGNVITVASPHGGNILSPATCLLSVGNAAPHPATLSPNPVDETTTLRFKTPVTGTLLICNAMGQVVAQVELQQQYEVRIGHRLSAPGVYFYRFSGAEGVATGSFVKE